MALPSVYSLIPHLPVLRRQLTSSLAFGGDDFSNAHFQLEVLPYCLDAASSALETLISEIETTVSDSLSPEPPGSRAIILPKPEVTARLSYQVDHFLDAARRTQNAWILYLSRRFSLSLPMSLSDLMDRLNKSPNPGLPEKIRHGVMEYWERDGKRLKDYRDLSQHHVPLMLSEARVFRASDGTPSIWLTLPNNPEVKSSSRLSFENPTIHAFSYVRDQYCELVAFSYWLCNELIEASTDRNEAAFAKVPRTWIGPSVHLPSHPIPTESAVAQEINERIATLRLS
jgi:hypothetical protein